MSVTICGGQTIAMPCVEPRKLWHLNNEQNEHSGSRCQGGVHTEGRLMRQGGWWGSKSLRHWAAPRLDSHGALIYEWMTLITSLYTLRGMELLQMGLWGIGRGRHHLNRVMRLACVAACVKSTMISTLLTSTPMMIKTAMVVKCLHSLKHTWKGNRRLSAWWEVQHSFCQINVALLRGPLVDHLLADTSMGQPPAPNDPSDVRHCHKIAWKWWFGALKFQSAHYWAQ